MTTIINTCRICLEQDPSVTNLTCGMGDSPHTFHQECLNDFFPSGRTVPYGDSICPLCIIGTVTPLSALSDLLANALEHKREQEARNKARSSIGLPLLACVIAHVACVVFKTY